MARRLKSPSASARLSRLLPVELPASQPRPDFLARLRAIYGARMLKVSGAELLAKERSR